MTETAFGLRVGVVGAGRVGVVLGAAFAAAGPRVVAVSGSSEASRRRAADLLPGVPVTSDPREVVDAADLVLFAVPDDALPGLISGLADAGAFRPGHVVVHVSGAAGLAVLAPAVARGAAPLALHPAMTFTGTRADLPRLVGCPMAVTARAGDEELAEAMVRSLGGEPFRIAEADRTAYHAALCHGANHLFTLVGQAAEILAGVGVADPATVLRPLLEASLDNVLRRGEGALTGPVARGDIGTVAGHLAALDARPEIAETYRALARATALRAAGRGQLAADAAAQLVALLSAEPPPR